MKVALINDNSQASKNEIIYNSLNKACEKYNHKLFNYGMKGNNDSELTYVQAGLLAAILINSKAADFIVTGCGTGQGAMLATNSFPNMLCGHIVTPTDAYLFSQINAGNAVSIPFAQGFGWGSEITLDYVFDKLFSTPFGGGYPIERREPEQRNKKVLDSVKEITHNNMITILKNIDQEFLYNTVNREEFKEYFFENATDEEIIEYIKKIINK